MAINWGVALGAAAESGFKTYERLGEEEYREMMREKMRKERDQEKQFESAMANARKVDYTGGEAVADTVAKGLNFTPEQQAEFNSGLNQLTPDKQAEVLRAYSKSENATGGVDLSKIGVYKGADGNYMASNESKPRNSADIYRDVANEMQASGNTTGLMKAIGIKTAVRESDLQDKFDDWSAGLRTNMMNLQTTINNKGLSGVPAVVNPELKKAGITTEYVEGKDGGSIVARQGGKVIGTFGSGDDVLGAVMNLSLESLASQLLPMLGSPQAVASFIQGQQQIGIKKREVDIKAADSASNAAYRKGVLANADRNFEFEKEKWDDQKGDKAFTQDLQTKNYQLAVERLGLDKRTADRNDEKDSRPLRIDMKDTTITTSENGVSKKTPVKTVTSVMPNGTLKFEAFTLDGKPVTDNAALAQIASGDAGPDAVYSRMLELAMDRYKSGQIDLKGFETERKTIGRMFGKDITTQAVKSGLGDVFGTPDKKTPPEATSNTTPAKTAIPYTPPSGSPAARAQANREAVVTEAGARQSARVAATKEADARVTEALPSMTVQEAYALQRSPQFDLLSAPVKAAVQKKVLGK